MWPMLIMAGVNALSDEKKEERQNKLASAQTRYSPWTGIRAQPVAPSNPTGDLAQGYAGGMAMDQNQANQGNQQKLIDAQIKAMNAYSGRQAGQQSPMMGGGAGPMSMSGGQSGGSPWSSLYNNPLGQTTSMY